jgi:hypothetical protein
VKGLVGTPLHRLGILRNLSPDSSRYDANAPEKNYSLKTFDEHPTTRTDNLSDRSACYRWKVALLEMTNHEFLDPGRRRERSTFADGTTVTVDWDAATYAVGP